MGMMVVDQNQFSEAGTGRYSNWRILGRGGTANVYRVCDNELGCDVAIKILKAEILHSSSANREMMKRSLRTEVLISRRLRHHNICAIHDLYDGPEGFGTVMDLIDGVELRDWMNDHLNDRLATAEQRLSLLRKIGEALAYAHTQIVHRDLKPQNIFLRNGDITQPVIMDFGFSVIGGKTDQDTSLAFTPKYMAPEQYEAPEKVDRRADLFAFGIMAYELFAGQVPPHSLKDILKTRKPPRIPLDMVPPPSNFNEAVRPALDRIILQLTAYEPERRIQSADELVTALAKPEILLYPPEALARSGDAVSGGMRSMTAVEVPGGEYFLGGRAGAKSTMPNELPTRRVTIAPFLIDRWLVTNREYLEFVESTGRPRPPLHDHPTFGAPNHPVVGVTFDEALQFARAAGGMLPSEAQWEYTARAGQKLIEYPWGDAPPTPTRANINNISRTTSAVDAYPEGAGAFDIYDMCGNVWEWCLDVYEDKFYTNIQQGALNPVNNPAKVDNTKARVLRGGSFQSFAAQGRCSFRSSAPATERRNDIGFRLVYRKPD